MSSSRALQAVQSHLLTALAALACLPFAHCLCPLPVWTWPCLTTPTALGWAGLHRSARGVWLSLMPLILDSSPVIDWDGVEAMHTASLQTERTNALLQP